MIQSHVGAFVISLLIMVTVDLMTVETPQHPFPPLIIQYRTIANIYGLISIHNFFTLNDFIDRDGTITKERWNYHESLLKYIGHQIIICQYLCRDVNWKNEGIM